jgi:PST family polysaccharide transporter
MLKKSISWSLLSQIFKIFSQVIVIFIFSKILTKIDFGIYAILLSVISFVNIFREIGISSSIIQQKRMDNNYLSTAYWFILFNSIILSFCIFFFSSLISKYYKNENLLIGLKIISILPVLQSIGSIHISILEKQLKFKLISIIEICSLCLSFAVSFILIRNSYGYIALVLQTIIFTLTNSLLYFYYSNWVPSFIFKIENIKNNSKFTVNLFLYSLVNYLFRNSDTIIIGRVLGAGELGIYNMAIKLMLWPLQQVTTVVSRILFPRLSIDQENNNKMSETFQKAVILVSFISAPLMIFLFEFRYEAIFFTLGIKWVSVSTLLLYLCPVGYLQSISSLVGSIYFSKGRSDLILKWGIGSLVVTSLSLYIGTYYSLIGVTISYFVGYLIIFIPSLVIPFKLVNLNWKILLRKNLIILYTSIVLLVFLIFIKAQIAISSIYSLGIIFLFSMILYVSVFYLFNYNKRIMGLKISKRINF